MAPPGQVAEHDSQIRARCLRWMSQHARSMIMAITVSSDRAKCKTRTRPEPGRAVRILGRCRDSPALFLACRDALTICGEPPGPRNRGAREALTKGHGLPGRGTAAARVARFCGGDCVVAVTLCPGAPCGTDVQGCSTAVPGAEPRPGPPARLRSGLGGRRGVQGADERRAQGARGGVPRAERRASSRTRRSGSMRPTPIRCSSCCRRPMPPGRTARSST